MLTWPIVCRDSRLADLPYKIELTAGGKIVMSPHHSKHAIRQGNIEAHLRDLMTGGQAFPECPVDTADNTKQVDVVWASDEKIARFDEEFSWPEAPEICVEVVSPSNTFAELSRKMALYFERGAIECWICSSAGEMSFFSSEGPLEHSRLCPQFPVKIGR